jgi:NADH-quinone oxidoreductase subunit J
MSAGSLLFAFCTLVCLLGALATILARNPIRSAVGLLATIFGIAGLFLQLRAEFLAAIQLIVYAGAVVVLFVFVIMLLGPDAGAEEDYFADGAPGRFARGFSIVAVLGMAGAAVFVLLGASGEPVRFSPVPKDHGSIEAVGTLLFTRGLVPFELATVLLIVAVIGAIALARSKPRKVTPIVEPSPTKRMFRGPIPARDTGRSLDEGSGQ